MSKKFTGLKYGLAVAFELNFPHPLPKDLANIVSGVEAEDPERVRHEPKGGITRFYIPSKQTLEKDGVRFIVFPADMRNRACFARFMFRRNHRDMPVPRMAAGRHGEEKPFGFSVGASLVAGKIEDTKHYLPLAYPGKSGVFVPVYIKQSVTPEPTEWLVPHDPIEWYRRIDASDEERETVIIRITEEAGAKVPLHLQKFFLNF